MPGARSAKKAQTPPKSVKSKSKGQKYDYVELGKASLSSVDTHNAYGVIVDATFPYKVNQSLYVCSLKIADSSLNCATKGGDYATVTMYAKRFEDLPIVLRMGDIIRLHRATLPCTTTADSSTSPCTGTDPGLFSPPTRPPLLVLPPVISPPLPTPETAPPWRDKTRPFSPTCASGPPTTSPPTML